MPVTNNADIRQVIQTELQTFATRLEQQTPDVEGAVKATVARTLKTVLVPALEAVVSQVVEQAAQQLARQDSQAQQSTEALEAQVATLTQHVKTLSTQVTALAPTTSPPAPPLNQLPEAQVKTMIDRLLAKKHYQKAFELAMNAHKMSVVLYCCRQVDVSAIMEGAALNPILRACLLQQLSNVIKLSPDESEIDTALGWMPEIAYSLSPPDPSLQGHLRTIVDQTTAHVQSRIAASEGKRQRALLRVLQIVPGYSSGIVVGVLLLCGKKIKVRYSLPGHWCFRSFSKQRAQAIVQVSTETPPSS